MQKTISIMLIVWHSRTNASKQCAERAHAAALDVLQEMESQDTVTVRCLSVDQVTTEHVLNADAYLFCAPENLGGLSGEMKAFFDQNYYAALGQLNGKPYGAIVCAGSAGQGAAQQIERICTGWRLDLVQPIHIVNTSAQTPEEILALKTLDTSQTEAAAELGGLLAAKLALSH